jgi:hypothetical protein
MACLVAASSPVRRWATRVAILALLAILAAPGSVAGGKKLPRRLPAPLMLKINAPHRLRVEPVRSRELLGGRSLHPIVFHGEAMPQDVGLVTSFQRELPHLWELHVPLTKTAPSVQVVYELIGDDGRRDLLTHRRDGDSQIFVEVEPLPQRVLAGPPGEMVLEGGVVLHLDVQKARFSGEYGGTLVISVNRF